MLALGVVGRVGLAAQVHAGEPGRHHLALQCRAAFIDHAAIAPTEPHRDLAAQLPGLAPQPVEFCREPLQHGGGRVGIVQRVQPGDEQGRQLRRVGLLGKLVAGSPVVHRDHQHADQRKRQQQRRHQPTAQGFLHTDSSQ